jgi:hypothetical protein
MAAKRHKQPLRSQLGNLYLSFATTHLQPVTTPTFPDLSARTLNFHTQTPLQEPHELCDAPRRLTSSAQVFYPPDD